MTFDDGTFLVGLDDSGAELWTVCRLPALPSGSAIL